MLCKWSWTAITLNGGWRALIKVKPKQFRFAGCADCIILEKCAISYSMLDHLDTYPVHTLKIVIFSSEMNCWICVSPALKSLLALSSPLSLSSLSLSTREWLMLQHASSFHWKCSLNSLVEYIPPTALFHPCPYKYTSFTNSTLIRNKVNSQAMFIVRFMPTYWYLCFIIHFWT